MKMLIPGVIVGIVAAILILLCGCRTVKYVPVEHTTYRTVNHTDTIQAVDSVIYRDTVSCTTQGDTVLKTQIKWRILRRNVYKAQVDTVNHTDTIVRVVKEPVGKATEKQTTIQKIKSSLRWLLAGFAIGIMLTIILNRYCKRIITYFFHS